MTAAQTHRGSILTITIVTLVFLSLAWRQHQFVDKYAVNILYMDQWDFYNPLFTDASWWDTFTYEHGPHRQGAGLVVTRVTAGWNAWNVRWDAFAASFLLIGAAGLAIVLARLAGAHGGLGVAAIPLLFFNMRQYELFVGATNISHAAMPLALLMGLQLAWFIPSPGRRLAALCGLSFLLIFTGFGLFAGLLTPLVLIVEAIQAARRGAFKHLRAVLIALAVIVVSWILFAVDYRYQPAVADFRFPHDKPVEYVLFISMMLANFFGVSPQYSHALAAGFAVAAALGGLCLWHGYRLMRDGVGNSHRSVAIFNLAAFALLYCAFTAVGRVVLGWPYASLVSRYVTLMVPAGLAMYLHVASLPSRRIAGTLALAFALLLLPGTARLRGDDWAGVRWYADGKQTWKAAYLETRDEDEAAQRADFDIHPDSQAEKLQFLEERHLNLFAPRFRP